MRYAPRLLYLRRRRQRAATLRPGGYSLDLGQTLHNLAVRMWLEARGLRGDV